MREQTFTYNGESLSIPLQELIDWAVIKIASLEEEVKQIKAIDDKTYIKSRSLGAALSQFQKPMTTDSEKMLSDTKWSLNRAKNWLRECKRTPNAEWVLDFGDLDWLYRQKKDS